MQALAKGGMICETCHGQTNLIPICTTCGGTGVAHCCDGDRAEIYEWTGFPMFSVKPEWAEHAAEYPIVKAG